MSGRRPGDILRGDAGDELLELGLATKAREWRRDQIKEALEELAFEERLGIESLLLLIVDLLQEQ
jgi:hypothetical protein